MEQLMQLRHPAGKKAVRMDRGKYDVLKTPLLNHLKTEGGSTHKEILRAITEDLVKKKTPFDGSIEWHMEWVKLDLEARKEIKRVEGKSPIRFALVN